MLRVFAILMQSVASNLQMIRRQPRVNVTRAMPTVLPRDTGAPSRNLNAPPQATTPAR